MPGWDSSVLLTVHGGMFRHVRRRCNWRAGRVADVVCLFHEEEQKNEAGEAEDGAPVQDPLPALAIVDEASNDGGEEIATGQQKGVEAQIPPPLVCEIDVGDRNLAQTLDGRAEKALQELAGDPLAVGRRVRPPQAHGHGAETAEQIDGPLAVLQGHGLPEKTAPAGEQE